MTEEEFYKEAKETIEGLQDEGMDIDTILEILSEQLDEGSEEISDEMYELTRAGFDRAVFEIFGIKGSGE